MILNRGRDAAESIGSIAERTGQSRRTVERELERMAQSLPIVACERGVYLAETPQEARAYAQSLRGRIVAVQARVTALERWAEVEEMSGQETLWGTAA